MFAKTFLFIFAAALQNSYLIYSSGGETSGWRLANSQQCPNLQHQSQRVHFCVLAALVDITNVWSKPTIAMRQDPRLLITRRCRQTSSRVLIG
jgi:hypothetical protein